MSDAYLAEELRQEYVDRMGTEKIMERKNYILRQLAACFHTGVFLLQDGQMEHYEDNPEYNPLWQSEGLRLPHEDNPVKQDCFFCKFQNDRTDHESWICQLL